MSKRRPARTSPNSPKPKGGQSGAEGGQAGSNGDQPNTKGGKTAAKPSRPAQTGADLDSSRVTPKRASTTTSRPRGGGDVGSTRDPANFLDQSWND